MKLGENIHLMSALCCRNISLIGSKLWIFFALPSFWPVRFSLNHPLLIEICYNCSFQSSLIMKNRKMTEKLHLMVTQEQLVPFLPTLKMRQTYRFPVDEPAEVCWGIAVPGCARSCDAFTRFILLVYTSDSRMIVWQICKKANKNKSEIQSRPANRSLFDVLKNLT